MADKRPTPLRPLAAPASRRERRLVLWFEEIGRGDVPLVGGKNASLGELIRGLGRKGVRVPGGFAITAHAYRTFIEKAGIGEEIRKVLGDLDPRDLEALSSRGKRVRDLIAHSAFPADLQGEIVRAYKQLSRRYGALEADVAVRSSATAEDLPEASFAGQQETFLNVRGELQLLDAVRHCFASLFTNRAIAYRADHGFGNFEVSLSVGIQKMVRSDAACSGVMFTLDPETGYRDVVTVSGAYGLGENVVQGVVNPDEFTVHKPTLRRGFPSIVGKRRGNKAFRLVYTEDGASPVKNVPVPKVERERYVLADAEVLELARWGVLIEEHYGCPMDIEWAKDGDGAGVGTGKLFIVQARPETVQAQAVEVETYRLERPVAPTDVLLRGTAVGARVGRGSVRVIPESSRIGEFQAGEVLVTDMTDPDWEPIMKLAAGIVTNRGGRTCHAAIVSRELGIPCVIGTEGATRALRDGQEVTVDCSEGAGRVLRGGHAFHVDRLALDEVPDPQTDVMLLAGIPEQAFMQARYPADGVGLAREEFIISSQIGIHPLALLEYDRLKELAEGTASAEAPAPRGGGPLVSPYGEEEGERIHPRAETPAEQAARNARDVVREIDRRTPGYVRKADFFVDELARGIGTIAAAFYREAGGRAVKDVIVRLSDFKSNEYASLIGGKQYEPSEHNPMLGWRGASRYSHSAYEPAFALECQAIRKVRDEMGLTNVKVMVPFCRTVEEARQVLRIMARHGLRQGENGLEVYMMAEIPSNVILADRFAAIFDGFSIGSNDLAQLALGLDRDSELVQHLYDERDPAVRRLLEAMLRTARAHRPRRKTGICGQAPSDFPSIAALLVELGIDSMAVNTDTLVNTRILVYFAEAAKAERKRLVTTEEDSRTGRAAVKLGVTPAWLKAKALAWVRGHVTRAAQLPAADRQAVATLLEAMRPRVVLDRPGGDREVLCWKPGDADAGREGRAQAVRRVDVRPVEQLSVRALVRKAQEWLGGPRAAGQRMAPLQHAGKSQALVKRYDGAHAEFLATRFVSLVQEMVAKEARRP